jgi:hypothetical protein
MCTKGSMPNLSTLSLVTSRPTLLSKGLSSGAQVPMTITIGIGYFARGGAPGRARKYSALAPIECECRTEAEGVVMKIAKLLAGRRHSTRPRNGIKPEFRN